MNTVVIVGRAGRDAEIKYYESGKSRATFSLAVNRWDSKTSSEVTDWFNIEVWDKQAEFASNYLKKGRLAAIEGRIRKATGQIRRVKAVSLILLRQQIFVC